MYNRKQILNMIIDNEIPDDHCIRILKDGKLMCHIFRKLNGRWDSFNIGVWLFEYPDAFTFEIVDQQTEWEMLENSRERGL